MSAPPTGPSPTRAFWVSFGLSALALFGWVALVTRGFAFAGGPPSASVVLGLLAAVFIASILVASSWGGRYAVYGVLAGIPGVISAVILFVFLCIQILGTPFD